MTPEQLRQEADRQARAIWDQAKLPGDGAVWIADAIVGVAMRHAAEEDAAKHGKIEGFIAQVSHYRAENARLAAEAERLKAKLTQSSSDETPFARLHASEIAMRNERDQLSAQLAERDAEIERLREALKEARRFSADCIVRMREVADVLRDPWWNASQDETARCKNAKCLDCDPPTRVAEKCTYPYCACSGGGLFATCHRGLPKRTPEAAKDEPETCGTCGAELPDCETCSPSGEVIALRAFDECAREALGPARLAASDGYVDHAITTLIQECDAARAEAEKLRETIVQLDAILNRCAVLDAALVQSFGQAEEDEIARLRALRLLLLDSAGVKERCTAGEAR